VTRPRIWPWVVVIVMTLVVYAPSGNVPGVRRTVALAVVAALVLGVAVDLLAGALARGRRLVLTRVAVAAAAAAILVPLGVGLAGWQNDFARGARTLSIDFPFPLRPGASMPETLDYLTDELRSGRMDAEEIAATWEGERTLAIIRLLAERRGESTAGLPTAEEITALTFEGPRCYQQCTPVPGRP